MDWASHYPTYAVTNEEAPAEENESHDPKVFYNSYLIYLWKAVSAETALVSCKFNNEWDCCNEFGEYDPNSDSNNNYNSLNCSFSYSTS